MIQTSRLKDPKYYVNLNEGCVYCGDEVVAEINSAIHLQILDYLSRNPKQWLSKNLIIENCWPDRFVEDNTFYPTISHLRAIHPAVADSIESKKGQGYKYHGLKQEEKHAESGPQQISYFKSLWKSHVRYRLRDQNGPQEATRDMIEFYAIPELTDQNNAALDAPFFRDNKYTYITVGSGLGKTTLLHMALLTNIVEPLIDQSDVVGERSREMLGKYQKIRQVMFGENAPLYFPVFINSPEAEKNEYESLVDLADAHSSDSFKDLLETANKSGTLLFLIDSVDEISDTDRRRKYMKDIGHLLKTEYPNAKAIITSRYMGRTQLPVPCKTVHIKALNTEAIEEITNTILVSDQKNFRDGKLAAIRNNRYLASIVTNPFMLVTYVQNKQEDNLTAVLNLIVSNIIQSRWEGINECGLEDDEIMLLLGNLACRFVFGGREGVSRKEVETAFGEISGIAEKQYGFELNLDPENIQCFLRLLPGHSGIVNLMYDGRQEQYVFQDRLIMCWLASNYIRYFMENAYENHIESFGDEIWCLRANAAWIGRFVAFFGHSGKTDPENMVNTLLMLLSAFDETGAKRVQLGILNYLMMMDISSRDHGEKGKIAEGYSDILQNTFGTNSIANKTTDFGYRQIALLRGCTLNNERTLPMLSLDGSESYDNY